MQKLVSLGLLVLVVGEHVDLSFSAKSASSSDSMDEIGLVKWYIVENHKSKVFHVHASGGDIGGQQDPNVSSVLSLVSSIWHVGVLLHHLVSLVEILLAVKSINRVAVLLEELLELGDMFLTVSEHNHSSHVVLLLLRV